MWNTTLSSAAGRRPMLCAAAILVVLGAASFAQAADKPAAKPAETPEAPIRASADAFVKAFNAGDAKAVAALWAHDAEYTDEAGQAFHGRAAIEREYAELFKQHPGATITLAIESIRFLGSDTAMEKGVARVKPKSGEALAARYSVVHAKRDGAWTMVVGRDEPYVPAPSEDSLKSLDWLIGDWTLDSKDHSLQIRFEWLAQKNFIRNTFTVVKNGQATLTGGQIIGWHPKLGRVVSWHFSADGGFGEDVWAKEGSKWVIRASGIARNGSESTSTNTITPVDGNSFTWQSARRTLDGVNLPDAKPVKIVRVQAGK